MQYIITFIFCVFMGITGVSLGLGTAFPVINKVAEPLVCSGGGTLSAVKTYSNPAPGKSYTTATWSCEDASGKKTPVDKFVLALYAGTIYGLGMFALVALLMMIGGRGKAKRAG
ncbi:MAG: hypothetical protein JWM80_6153 [Cyanobacteria bacterium RYN_339]|nr:hypothetical protein [Cyanobacteria bacterium RYN_339]